MITAHFTGQKTIQSRGTVALTFEVPLAYGLEALRHLGLPDAENPVEVVIKRLTSPRLIDCKAVAEGNSEADYLSAQPECDESQPQREAGNGGGHD